MASVRWAAAWGVRRMTKILLIRHGHVEGIEPARFRGRQPLELTAQGRAEVVAVAKRIASRWQPRTIYTSPMARCVKTAEAVAEVSGIAVQICDDLNDLDYGAWQFKTFRQAKAEDPVFFSSWFAVPHLVRFPAGESLQDLDARTTNALRLALSRHPAAREFEVLVNRVVAPIKRQRTHRDGMRAFIDELARKREAAAARAQNAVQSTRFGALALDIAAWLQAGHWITPQDDLVRDPGDLPITIFAAEQLTRRWRKLRKKRKTLAQLNARGRHKLRIQTKKLRYAAEFFATLFASKRAAKQLKRLLPVLERLQDGLGELNDIAVDEERLAAVGIRRGSNPNRAFAAGLLSGREDARIEAAMAAATTACAELAKVKPFWR
jgi:broad specificity phosphatase PhoE